MATTILKLTAILSLNVSLLLSLLPQATFSFRIKDDGDDGEEYYVLDQPLIVTNLLSKSRFLSHTLKKDRIRKGTHCDPNSHRNICNGISANNGTSLLYCCKTHCRNVLGDWNNCGQCGNRCKFGQRCCGGVCTDVMYNADHCGKCDNQCMPGVKCEFGSCGYA